MILYIFIKSHRLLFLHLVFVFIVRNISYRTIFLTMSSTSNREDLYLLLMSSVNER